MTKSTSELEALYQEVARCSDCGKADQRIANLDRTDFMFHWIPYFRGELSFRYIFLAWEPAFQHVETSLDYPREGSFNEPLLFAINKFLAPKSFLITNMAKCSIHTGPLCDQTWEKRYRLCSRFLRREVQLGLDSETCIVSIGLHPAGFVSRHRELYPEFSGRRICRITHYGLRANRHFSDFAKKHGREYERFRQSNRPEYEAFIQQDFRGYYGRYSRHPEQDLQRLFLWSRQMSEMANCRTT